ncbi:MAG: hypothetical protein K2O32_00745 [Acetatifactor sp.]|nr:hypothetical protein [Acetatifactor sp.]
MKCSDMGMLVSMKEKQQIIYYQNELEDEFSRAKIQSRRIDQNYSYDNGKLCRRIGHRILYSLCAKPLARLFLHYKFHHCVVNRDMIDKTFVESGRTGFFLYGNHTHALADALIPSMVCDPVDAYVIVHPNNVSMPILGRITPCLGALPLPDDKVAARNFIEAVQREIERGNCVVIYPEAHIWPYYTKIRPFSEASFRYPLQFHVPVFCFTNTYQRRRRGKGVDIVTYVDGPFYGDDRLKGRQQRKELRDRVYAAMTERSRENRIERIKYIKVSN